jgi:hypothetical protein
VQAHYPKCLQTTVACASLTTFLYQSGIPTSIIPSWPEPNIKLVIYKKQNKAKQNKQTNKQKNNEA